MIASSLAAMFTLCETSSLTTFNAVDPSLFQTPASVSSRAERLPGSCAAVRRL
jgi:hypothetical protein